MKLIENKTQTKKMDLLKTPSVQSLLDSDLESVESLQYLDVEELDEIEYALPVSAAPSLAEVLSADDDICLDVLEADTEKVLLKPLITEIDEPTTCSALQAELLQAVSQQIIQAQERSSTGAATALSVGSDSKITVGTAHGHLLSFHEQTLRWVCDANTDRGAVSCLAYNNDSTRLLVGYARGLIIQYESIKGTMLRKVTLGGELWGALRVTWAGTSGLALDTGGSVWLIKFSRPLGVRSARASCLFSGARGEVVSMAARDARILALATLSRVIIVAGGRASGIHLVGPPDTLPVLSWCESEERILVCARGKILQWLSINITGNTISIRPIQRVELKSSPLWLGWLGNRLAVFDSDENIRLCGEDYDKPLDLSYIEPVYASAFFKGVWTDGRVSRAMFAAGSSALGGACVSDGALSIVGRRGVVRVRPRDNLARAKAFMTAGKHLQALRLLCSLKSTEAQKLALAFVYQLSERPHLLSNKQISEYTIKLCLKHDLSEEIWNSLWDCCNTESAFVEALSETIVRGELSDYPPSPDYSQAIIERLAEFEPELVERVVASLPLTSIDPHRASVFAKKTGLWRAVAAIAAALGGPSGAMWSLVEHVSSSCGARDDVPCSCAGDALLVTAADALAGRGAGGRPLPDHTRPAARHDALRALLNDVPSQSPESQSPTSSSSDESPLAALVRHDARAATQLVRQSAREPPFAGPLAKHNRLRVARALLQASSALDARGRLAIAELLAEQVENNALPVEPELVRAAAALAAALPGESAHRAWLALCLRPAASADPVRLRTLLAEAPRVPRILWRISATLGEHRDALDEFLRIDVHSARDVEELLAYLRSSEEARAAAEPHVAVLAALRPDIGVALLENLPSRAITSALRAAAPSAAICLGESLLDAGRLSGEAAQLHLRNLCELRPRDAASFLRTHPGLVRPEEAVAIARDSGAGETLAVALESVGDAPAALDELLRLAQHAADAESAKRLTRHAGELVSRTAPFAPPEVAGEMWARVLRSGRATPALALQAVAHVPASEALSALAATGADGLGAALALLRAGAAASVAWRAARGAARRDARSLTARALAAAQRGLPVRGGCSACGVALLAGGACRTLHCGRAAHVGCPAEEQCGVCQRRLPAELLPLPARASSLARPALDFELMLSAPPRPDLEGVA